MNPDGPIGDRRGMTQTPVLAIVLAAGKGTRMKSDTPKVMHELAGAPLIAHVLKAVRAAGIGRIAAVVGPGMEDVAGAAQAFDSKVDIFVQKEQAGTADAVKAALPAFAKSNGPVVVVYGDTPLLQAETL